MEGDTGPSKKPNIDLTVMSPLYDNSSPKSKYI